jgi:molybdate transport system substrate-binding protein
MVINNNMSFFALVLCISLIGATAAQAAEIKIITTGAVQRIERPMAEEFGAANGHQIETIARPMGVVRQMIESGEEADIIIASNVAMDSFLAAGAVAEGTIVPVGHIGMGVAVQDGAPQPLIGTVDEFRAAMLSANSLVHMDPAARISSGIKISRIFAELGIADQIADKTVLLNEGLAAEHLLHNDTKLAIQNMTQLMSVDGVTIVGPLPSEIQVQTTYVSGVSPQSRHKEIASAFIAYMTRDEADELWSGIGIEPGAP